MKKNQNKEILKKRIKDKKSNNYIKYALLPKICNFYNLKRINQLSIPLKPPFLRSLLLSRTSLKKELSRRSRPPILRKDNLK
jgi:hypothetical protein